MSTVYRAFDTVLERPVAIKLMHREIASDADQLERFRREARAVAQLSHPHIVTVIDAGEEPPGLGMRQPRGRRRRGGRDPVHRLRVRRRRNAEGDGPPHRAAGGHRGARLRDRDRAGVRGGARAPHRAPRREAAERAAHRGGHCQDHRLRHRPDAHRAGAHAGGARARDHRLRLPRAGPRAPRDGAVGHLLAGCGALRDAHRHGAVHRREPGGGRDAPRPRGDPRRAVPPAGGLRRDRRRRGARDRQGPRPALPRHARAAARPRGGAGGRGRARGGDHRRGHDGAAHSPCARPQAGAVAPAPPRTLAGFRSRCSAA